MWSNQRALRADGSVRSMATSVALRLELAMERRAAGIAYDAISEDGTGSHRAAAFFCNILGLYRRVCFLTYRPSMIVKELYGQSVRTRRRRESRSRAILEFPKPFSQWLVLRDTII